MAKLLGPDFISLPVRDLTVSRMFYTETLGLEVDARFNAPDSLVFDTTTIPFMIREQPRDPESAPYTPWGVMLWLDCDDVDGLSARLEAGGVRVLKHPFDGPFGRTFIFADPDGNAITANQNPWDRFPLGGRPRNPA